MPATKTYKPRTSEYRVTFQRAATAQDASGKLTLTGENFSNLCDEARRRGYPRVVAGEARQITPWAPIARYELAARNILESPES